MVTLRNHNRLALRVVCLEGRALSKRMREEKSLLFAEKFIGADALFVFVWP